MSLFRRKDLSALQVEVAQDHSLKRALGPVNLVTLGIGAIIGAGIFVLTGQAAAQLRRPGDRPTRSSSPAWPAPSRGSATPNSPRMIPIAGCAYTYGYATLGELLAWIIGWDLILEYLFAASTVAVGWSGYVVSFLRDVGIDIPPQYTSAPYTHVAPPDAGLNVWRLFTEGWSSTGAVLNVPAMFIVGGHHHPADRGHQRVGDVQQHRSWSSSSPWCCCSSPSAWPYINRENWEPFIPPQRRATGKFGWDGIVRGRGGDLLRLHRIRRGVHGRAGGQEPAARHAHRHPRLAGHLHHTLHRRGAGAHRHRQLHQAQRARPDRRRHQRGGSGAGVAASGGEDRRDRGSLLGHPGHVARASRASSTPCRRTGSCPRSSARCIPGSARPGSRVRSPACWPWCSRGCCRSACWVSWSPSGPCSPSPSCAPGYSCSGTPTPNGRARSGRRWCLWFRSSASWPASI